jgi:hypothetical protein
VEAYPLGATAPAASVPFSNVPDNTTVEVDFLADGFNPFGSGNGAFGYVILRGSSGDIAVVGQNVRNLGAKSFMTSYKGLDASQAAGLNLVAPIIYSDFFDWRTGITVINTGGAETTVTFSYVNNKGQTGSTQKTLGANQATDFFVPSIMPKKSFGSATISSSATPILAMVNNARAKKGFASATEALNVGAATNRIAVPIVLNTSGGAVWRTGVTIYSLDSTTINATFVREGVDPNLAGNKFPVPPVPAGANSVVNIIAQDFVSSEFTGVLFLEASPGTRIMTVVNVANNATGYAGQIPGFNY